VTARHLAKRFFGALAPGGPPPADEAWVASLLSAGEQALWRRMSGPDRRHAVGVARRVAAANVHQNVLAAALLHDVGKVESGLSTLERVPATLARPLRKQTPTRWRRYYDHPSIGAALLRDAGAADLTVAWAAEHHQPEPQWTVPLDIGRVLKAADDD
jgi:hypothetical protein